MNTIRAKSRKFYFQWRQLNIYIYTSIFFLEKDACISACKYELNDDD